MKAFLSFVWSAILVAIGIGIGEWIWHHVRIMVSP